MGSIAFEHQCLAAILSGGVLKVDEKAIEDYKKEASERDRRLKDKANKEALERRELLKQFLAREKNKQ